MTELPSPVLVSTEWLAMHLDADDIAIIDGTWFLPDTGRDALEEFQKQHIPGAVFFDINAIADTQSGLPHMLASPEEFARMVGDLGISETDTIIVYDALGLFSAARVRWNFKVMGAENVALLDGGLPKWMAEGRLTAGGIPSPSQKVFNASFDASAVADADSVASALLSDERQIIDARPAARFLGQADEPRPGVRRGHMPRSLNVPFSEIQSEGRLKSPEELKAVFEAAGADLEKPVTTSCGSGVTAAALALALEQVGKTDVTLYDGSWAEWGSDESRPVETEPTDG